MTSVLLGDRRGKYRRQGQPRDHKDKAWVRRLEVLASRDGVTRPQATASRALSESRDSFPHHPQKEPLADTLILALCAHKRTCFLPLSMWSSVLLAAWLHMAPSHQHPCLLLRHLPRVKHSMWHILDVQNVHGWPPSLPWAPPHETTLSCSLRTTKAASPICWELATHLVFCRQFSVPLCPSQ